MGTLAWLSPVFELAGPNRAVQIFGIRLVGVNGDNGKKLLFTAVFILILLEAGLEIASTTYEITGLPKIKVNLQGQKPDELRPAA